MVLSNLVKTTIVNSISDALYKNHINSKKAVVDSFGYVRVNC